MMRLFCALRLGTKNLALRLGLGYVFTFIEYCDDCGVRQPIVWRADDALWLKVTGEPGGVLCPRCFDRRATKLGLFLRWVPRDESGRFKPVSE